MQNLDNTALRESLRDVVESLRARRVDDSLERLLDIRDQGVTHRQLDARIQQLRDAGPGAVEAVLSWTLSFLEALEGDTYHSPLQWLEQDAQSRDNAHTSLEEASRHPTPTRSISPDSEYAAQSFDNLDAPPSIDFAIISEASEESEPEKPEESPHEESPHDASGAPEGEARSSEADDFFDIDSQWSEIALEVPEGEARQVEDMMAEEGDALGDDFSLGEELEALDDFDEIEGLLEPSSSEANVSSPPLEELALAESSSASSAFGAGDDDSDDDDDGADAGFQLFDEDELAEIERAASGEGAGDASSSSESRRDEATSHEGSSEISEPALTQRGVFDENDDVQLPPSSDISEQNPSAGTVHTSAKAAPFSTRKTPIRGTPIVVDFEDILDDENFDDLVRSSMMASGQGDPDLSSFPSSSIVSEGEDSGPSTDVAPPGTARDELLDEEGASEKAQASIEESSVEDEDDFDFDLGFSNPAERIESPANSSDAAEAAPSVSGDDATSGSGRFGAYSSPETDDTPKPLAGDSHGEEEDDFDFDLGFTNPEERSRSQKPTPVPVESQRSDTPATTGRGEPNLASESHPGHHQKTPAGGVSASLLQQAGSSSSDSKSGAFDPGRDSVSEDEFFALAEDIAREQSEGEETAAPSNKSYRGEPIVRDAPAESPPQPPASSPGDNPFDFDAPTGVHDPLAAAQSSSVVEEGPRPDLEPPVSLDAAASEVLMEARNAFVDRDLHRALTLLDEVLELDGEHDEASTLRSLVVEEIGEPVGAQGDTGGQHSGVPTTSDARSSEVESKVGASGLTDEHLECVPELEVDMSELATLDLDHRSGFLLAQIDGLLTIQDLIDLCSMSYEDTLAALSSMCENGIISLQ